MHAGVEIVKLGGKRVWLNAVAPSATCEFHKLFNYDRLSRIWKPKTITILKVLD